MAAPSKHKQWVKERFRYANEISLFQRLTQLFELFKEHFGTDKIKALSRKIVDTRNFLTHYDEGLKSQAAEGTELWVLVRKMDALLVLLFLHNMGFTSEEISQISRQENRLKESLRSDAILEQQT